MRWVIAHRDIKSANILVSQQGQVKVAHFGLAKLHDPASGGVTFGTPDYAAPELLISGTLVDHRADLYAMGVMRYNMLTGDIPLGVFNPVSRKVNAHSSFDDIIRKAMSADREKRYQTATAMKTDVQRAGKPRMGTSLLRPRITASPGRRPCPDRRRHRGSRWRVCHRRPGAG